MKRRWNLIECEDFGKRQKSRKTTSKKWGDSYIVQNLEMGELEWRNMSQYKDFRKIPDRRKCIWITLKDKYWRAK